MNKVALAGLSLLAVLVAACGSTTTATTNSFPKGAISVGELLPMTGAEAFVGQWFLHGIKAGIQAVNSNGGVDGHQFSATLEDTAGDPVDAVTALQTLLTNNPVVVFGPSSLEIEGVDKSFQTDHIVDIMEGGATFLDKMQFPYVYRVFPSDSVLLTGEAYYALHTGCSRASLIYTNDANAQAEVPPLLAAFKGHGGTVLSNQQIVAGQTSYLSEVQVAFQGNPQCVFFHADPQTASTLWANVQQLGHLNVRFITGDTGASIQLAQAMGLSKASKYLTGMAGTTPYSTASTAFLNAYQAVWNTRTALPASPAMYDGVVIAALAMTAAHSSNPVVWRPYITKISDPPGTACYTYPSCVKLLKQGKKINYQGASGNEDFNQYHNVFTPFQVVQFNTSGTLHSVYSVTTSDLNSYY
ncbi:MAG: ABC transporter substrate-binding protein [Candidatus Dormibacteria bacterium]